jgi:hypothetical protein
MPFLSILFCCIERRGKAALQVELYLKPAAAVPDELLEVLWKPLMS